MRDSFKKAGRSRGLQIFLALIAIILCVCVFFIRQNQPLPEGEIEIHFLDVGQGDSTLIATPDGCILIDTGESEEQEGVYLSASAYGTRLEYLILTHPHSDHTGGAAYILEMMDVQTVIVPRGFFENGKSNRILEAIIDSGASMQFAEPSDSFSLGDVKFTVLAPCETYEETNNLSIVLRMDYGKIATLFTGDAEVESELDQISRFGDYPGGLLDIDILKVGHHGSSTSSSMEYLTALSPSVAVISCGVDNSYGHPTAAVLDRLAIVQAEVLRTDQRGAITLITDGETVRLKGNS